MKKRSMFKRIVTSALAILTLSGCVITTNAVTADFTETYYMDGQKIYGQAVLYPAYATGTTYCELVSAGKKTRIIHYYRDTDGVQNTKAKGSLSAAYVYNNSTNLDRATTTPDDFHANVKAVGKHMVKTRDGMEWDSRGIPDNSVAK